MPLIDVSLARGRTPEQLRALIDALHEAAVTTANAKPESVTVILREVDHEHWASNNVTIAERNRAASGTKE